MNDPAKPKAAIYARISRDKKDSGATTKEQVRLCRELAKKYDLEVSSDHIYREPDGTGASEKSTAKKRVEYDKMIAAAKAKEFEYLLAYADDRLTRRPMELEGLISLVGETGLKIRTVRVEHYDLATSAGITNARIMSAIAANEARLISERQKVTFRRNAMEGKTKKQKGRPFGWREDWLTIEPEEAEAVREAIRQIKAGASIESIRRQWEDSKILTAKGNANWPHSVLKRKLTSWRMAGVSTYRGEPLKDANGDYVRGEWQPIISVEDREKALAMLEKRAMKQRREGRRKWILSGLVTCAECGGSLYGKLGKGENKSGQPIRDTYSCANGRGHNAIQAERLEEYVARSLANRLLRKLEAGELEEAKPKEPEEWPGQDRLDRVQAKIAELGAAYSADILTGETYFAQVQTLEQERKQLNNERKAFEAAKATPDLAFRRTSDLLDWAHELTIGAPYKRRESRDLEEWENQPWGSTALDDDEAEDAFEDIDPNAEDKILTLRRELKTALIKKGKRGGGSWKDEAFLARIELVWNDD